MITEIDTTETAELAGLRIQLEVLEYTTAEVQRLLGLTESAETVLGNSARYSMLYLHNLESHKTPAAVLARLFLFGGAVRPQELDLLPGQIVNLLRRLGFIGTAAEDERMIRGTVAITEYSGRYFLSDPLFENRGDDLVVHDGSTLCMPLHASSFELLRVLRGPSPGGSFLDVGCGTGCQSILYANDQMRVAGFDPSERCVMFAGANAVLNGFSARYTVDRWETFTADDGRFDHIAFNSPDPESAFGFLDARAAELLTDNGVAQVRTRCEMLRQDTDLAAMVARRLGGASLQFTVTRHENSPFSLSADHIRARTLPRGTLLVPTPSEREPYLKDLAERGVVEVVSATINARRR